MIEIIKHLWIITVQVLQSVENFSEPFLKDLDPSFFQNVVLGMLALLVPVGVGILSFFFEERSRGKVESNLELFILLRQVLKVKYIVLFSLFSLLLLSIYKVHPFLQIFALVFFIFYITWLILLPFRNILQWFLKNTKDFAINFLKNLNAKKDEKLLLEAWQALWLGDGPRENEREFTQIFISHIDNAIKYGKFELAVQLSQAYVNNIEKRDRFSIGYEILPKIFEWNEILWNEQQLWLKEYDTEKRIQNFISQKHFPTFKSWVLNIYKKLNSKRDCFWNWHYFGEEFFQAIIKVLLKDGHGPYQLFASFKRHVDESIEKLNKIEDEEKKKKYDHYITGLFASFCPTFFNEIDSAPSNYSIWEHDFPKEWKISMENTKSGIPRVILHEFLQWSRDRIFKKDNKEDFDKDLTEVINGIFPNVHSSLFTAFLMLFFSAEVKYALEKEPNFYILGTSVSWTGSAEESKEERDKRLAEMMREKEISQKEETIQIILNFFHFWPALTIYKDDLTEEESEKWKSFTEEERKLIEKRVRKEKLKRIKEELESTEIEEICKNDERKELYRKYFLELIKSLLLETEK